MFNIGGRLYGLLNRCAHQGGPVCAGGAHDRARSVADAEGRWLPRWELEGEIVACPWHGLEYHVPTRPLPRRSRRSRCAATTSWWRATTSSSAPHPSAVHQQRLAA